MSKSILKRALNFVNKISFTSISIIFKILFQFSNLLLCQEKMQHKSSLYYTKIKFLTYVYVFVKKPMQSRKKLKTFKA